MTTGLYFINQYKRSADPADDTMVCWSWYILAKSAEEAKQNILEAHKDEEYPTEFYNIVNPDEPYDITKPIYVRRDINLPSHEVERTREIFEEYDTIFKPE